MPHRICWNTRPQIGLRFRDNLLSRWKLELDSINGPYAVRFFLGKYSADPDFGVASGGEPRDLMNPDPVCP